MSCLYTWYQNCYMPELVHSLKNKKLKKKKEIDTCLNHFHWAHTEFQIESMADTCIVRLV